MARTVPPWLWAVLIRDHAPPISNVRLTLLMLRTYMDDSGYTYVGQKTLAAASCLSRPTVRKALEIAWREHWISVSSQGRQGKDWRHYDYRACIPDSVDIPEKQERLVLAFQAKYGSEVDTETHPDIAKVGKRVSHVTLRKLGNGISHVRPNSAGIPSEKDVTSTGRGKNCVGKVGKSTHQGGKNGELKVGNGVAPKSSSAEVFSKFSSEKGAALSRSTTHAVKSKDARIENETANDDVVAGFNIAKKRVADGLEAAAVDRARDAIAKWPQYSDSDIIKIARVNAEQLAQARASTA